MFGYEKGIVAVGGCSYIVMVIRATGKDRIGLG
jgi:hypothetical protein